MLKRKRLMKFILKLNLRSGENASITSLLTKITMMNMLNDLALPHGDYFAFKKKKVDYI